MAEKTPNKNQRQKQATIRIVMMICIIICVNVLASYLHAGLDLTKEKRFSLSPSTKTMLRNMKEVAVVDVYLKSENKFPAYLQRLQESVRERLASFKDIAGTKVVFRFVDPFEGKNDEEKKAVVHDLSNKGIRFFELAQQGDAQYSMQVFFPFALVQYNGKELPVMLLEDPPDKTTAEEKINYAEALLEYKFANAINELGRPVRARVAYIVGNNEDLGVRTFDLLTSIRRYYDLDTLDLMHTVHIPVAYDAIIINEPKLTFTGPEKLKIDQYIMRGGHVLWNVNSLDASIDSLERHPPQIMAMEYGLDLDDLLFKYGVRINNDLVEDMQNVPLARVVNGGPPELHDWVYFPKLNPTSEHPIVRNMDFIFGKFTNSIDTLKTSGINKTVLLQSSKYSRVASAPVRVSLSMMNFPLTNEMFNKPYRPVAVLLEGKFTSAYKNRLAPEYLRVLDSLNEPFKATCDSNSSMIVSSVGDLFGNDYTTSSGVLQMGYYKYDHHYYANKLFLLNCLQYLTDNSGILESHSKQVKLRLLDGARAKDEKTTWQFVNVGIPIGIVLVFASCYIFFRKRRYELKPAAAATKPPKSLS